MDTAWVTAVRELGLLALLSYVVVWITKHAPSWVERSYAAQERHAQLQQEERRAVREAVMQFAAQYHGAVKDLVEVLKRDQA